MKKRLLSIALVLTLVLVFALPAYAATYSMGLKPDRVVSNVQNYFNLVDTADSAGNPLSGSIPNEVLQNMTKIEVFMPKPEDSDDDWGLVAVMGGHGEWWCSTDDIPWKDGKVTINASDFPKKPSDVYKVDEENTGGYLVLVDSYWTATWAELGVTGVTITYTGSAAGSTTSTTTEGSSGTTTATGTPKVGDNNMLVLAIALLLASGTAFFFIRKKVNA